MRKITAVLHAHSVWSYDGRWSLERIARVYGALGIDAVLMTEHDTGFDPARFTEYRAACAKASTGRCTLIPGIEYSSPDNDIHILTWGLKHFLAEHRPITETLQAVAVQGGVAVFAHPVRRAAWRGFDPDWVPLLVGIELWNRKADGVTWGTEAARLIAETGLPATVGQDFHGPKQMYPLTHRFTLPKTGDLEQALVAALANRQGHPMAFGRRIMTAEGKPRTGLSPTLDRLRRGLRDVIRRQRR